MLTELQYQKLLPFKPNWQQMTRAGEVHCNINYWKVIVEVGKEQVLPINKAMHMKINQSCPSCKAEAIRAVMQLFDAYELAKQELNNTKKWKSKEKKQQ